MNYQDEAEEVVVEYLPISPFPFLFFFFKHVSPFPFWLIAFLLRIDFVTLQIDNHILQRNAWFGHPLLGAQLSIWKCQNYSPFFFTKKKFLVLFFRALSFLRVKFLRKISVFGKRMKSQISRGGLGKRLSA